MNRRQFVPPIVPARIEIIRRCVTQYCSVSMRELYSDRRARRVAWARQYAMYLARELTDYSLPKIAEMFGRTDHSNVIYACRVVALRSKNNPDIRHSLGQMRRVVVKGFRELEAGEPDGSIARDTAIKVAMDRLDAVTQTLRVQVQRDPYGALQKMEGL